MADGISTPAGGFSPEQVETAIAEANAREAAFRGDNTPHNPATAEAAAAAAARPEHVPEKFWKDGKLDTEGLLASYAEAEKKIGQPKPGEEKPKVEGEGEEKSKVEGDGEASKVNGVEITAEDNATWAPFYEEYASSGKLPEAAYEHAKTRFGVTDRSMVDAYVRGQTENAHAAAAEYATSIKTVAGGEEGYKAMTDWAAEVLSEAEIAEYNSAVNSRNPALARAATQALHFRMKAEGGVKPNLIGGRTAVQVSNGFANMDEMVAAINDTRYDKDPAYRRSVEAKIEMSQGVSMTRGSKSY